MTAYYNEHDARAAAWLRELINDGQIAKGEVDERSIEDIKPSELAGYDQCHFFAGIGGWSLALRRAGWPDTRPVWTGSCPCQPFSKAGKGIGVADERHLWPSFLHLIGQRRPRVVFGEQVASRAGLKWLAGVRADLEGAGYRTAGADLCAAGVAAPHLRQRLFWVADSDGELDSGSIMPSGGREGARAPVWGAAEKKQERYRRFDELVTMGVGERVASYAEARAILHGVPGAMGVMRGAGNAIVPEVAEKFITAYLGVRNDELRNG